MRNILLVVVLFLYTTAGLANGRNTQQLLQDLKNVSAPQEKAVLLNVITQHYWEIDPSLSVAYGLKAAAFCKDQGFQKLLATAYNNTSVAYYWLNNLPKATEFAKKSLKLRENLKDTIGLGSSYNNLGNLSRDQKQYAVARGYFQKALLIGHQQNKYKLTSTSLSNIGTVYELEKNYQKALDYYLQANAINQKAVDPYELAIDHFNIGNVYVSLQNKNKALYHLNKALAYSIQTENKVNEMYVVRSLAKLHIAQGNLKDALAYALQGLSIAKAIPSPEGVKESAQQLNEIYTAQREYQKAHQYLTLYTITQDSLRSQTQEQALAEVNAKYETDRSALEIKRLTAEHELHSEKLAQKTKEQYTVGILLFLIGALAVVFLRGRNRVQKVNQQLSTYNQLILEKNESIQEQANALAAQADLLQNQKEQLESLNMVKDRLFSIVAHDLRGPLISLQSLLQIISLGNLPPEKMAKFMEDLKAQQQNTLGLLDNLLMWAKIQMKGMQLDSKPLQVHQLVDQNIKLLLPQAQKKGIQLENHIQSEVMALADAETLKLVFRNLISNAIKFCKEEDQVGISAMLTPEGFLQITVKDTGKGISAENQSKLFGPNHYKEIGTANEKGNGLGLMLCKEFIEKNGGTIWVESEVGQGSQFHFTIPACEASLDSIPYNPSRKLELA
jgi:two-component system sensor histidine kinase/response regulator